MNATEQVSKFMCITVKLMKAKDKEKIVKTAIEKKLITFNRIIMKASRQWKDIFSSLTKKKKKTTVNFLPGKMILQKPRREKNRCTGLHQNHNDMCMYSGSKG